ncbi:hypothetical protein MFUR16E_17110 [Methylobacterium fujisawaense]|uniref:FAS1-like dehydratase domain-containing protein n=1 Tax=Methylobacterium fujisawaense TaxID=107400 RepID=UPI002F33F2DF
MSTRLAPLPDLKIDPVQVGRVVAERDVEVTFRRSAAYAAAIGSHRACYLDDRHPGGALAPPCLITALEWPLVSGAEHLKTLGIPKSELFSRLLHAFQDTRFDRPLRVGDLLRIEATLASVRATRSGALTTLRLVTRERKTGRPVAESWFGSFYRGVTVDQPHAALSPPAIEPSSHSGAASQESLTLTRAHAHLYGECAGLWNPIHTEPGFAVAAGFPDVALHGTMIWAMAGERIIDRHLAGDPTRLVRLAARFGHPIFPDCRLTLRVSPSPLLPCSLLIDAVRDDASVALFHGVAELRNS